LQAIGAQTIQPRSLVKPGHIFPVEAREGGVLVRAAIPEGALDIVRLAGHTDAALFVDLLNQKGELMGEEDTFALAQESGLPMLPLSSLISYRLQRETLVTRVAESTLPTTLAGDVRAIVYRSKIGDLEHFALVKGDVAGDEPVLTRVQAEQIVSDIFGGGSPASRAHLQNSLRAIEAKQRGIVVYLRRANGETKPQIDSHRAESSQTPTATLMREYGVGAQILRDLGVTKVELITSTPRLLEGLQNFGITVVAQHPIPELLPQKGHTV
jgi:3,4-dihydroxy 2-butanone 4-phosphate synthase/GTP cyclohydrolase II